MSHPPRSNFGMRRPATQPGPAIPDDVPVPEGYVRPPDTPVDAGPCPELLLVPIECSLRRRVDRYAREKGRPSLSNTAIYLLVLGLQSEGY